jgi:hypothetical protein
MNVSNSLSAARFSAALSSLSSANKQPQLALDLILKSLEGQPSAGAAQLFQSTVNQVQPVATADNTIDIRV